MTEKWRKIADQCWYEGLKYPKEETCDEADVIDELIEKIWNGETPSAVEVGYIVEHSLDIFKFEPNILEIEPPITVCGDIHGQFNDFKQLFKLGGFPPFTRFLFLGDYVDRGDKSIEVFMLLCLFKMKYPKHFFVLRGNHESINITKVYGFYQEMLTKYHTESVYNLFGPLFSSLPIAAIIGKKVFCVHGGISPLCPYISDIAELNRFSEVPLSGPLADLLWADPSLDNGDFTESDRNTGHRFGSAATDGFLERNHLNLIIRAHQMMKEGCQYCHHEKVLTIFSAPNYEGKNPNKGGYAVIDENLTIQLVRFTSAPLEPHENNLSSIVF